MILFLFTALLFNNQTNNVHIRFARKNYYNYKKHLLRLLQLYQVPHILVNTSYSLLGIAINDVIHEYSLPN